MNDARKEILEKFRTTILSCGYPAPNCRCVKAINETLADLDKLDLSMEEIKVILTSFITHILHYHDKEGGRTDDVEIIFKQRFGDVAQAIHEAQERKRI